MHLTAFATPLATPLPGPAARAHDPAVSRKPWQATAVVPDAAQRRPENAPGNFYVKSTCIDCDTCRWLAPDTFGIKGPQSHVHTQPPSDAAELHALRAAAACPTGSIRTETPHKMAEIAANTFPLPVFPTLASTAIEDVYFNGYTAVESFGCASWLVLHRTPTDSFAVMFDCPRYDPRLADGIRRVASQVGGLRYLVLSHKDDVAHHDVWAEELGVQRIIHETECVPAQGTDAAEIKLSDSQFPYKIGDGLELLHVPGHSPGSMAMLHTPSQSLFTGDHLVDMPRQGGLGSLAEYCTQSWSLQIQNVARLADIPFLHAWPGHMRHFHFRNAEERRKEIAKAVQFMTAMPCHLP